MLNKKAIAAFAAGATLLSGMAFAAPAFVSAPAFAETDATKPVNDRREDAQKKVEEARGKVREAEDAVKNAETKLTSTEKPKDVAFKANEKIAVAVAADGTPTATYKLSDSGDTKGKLVKKDNNQQDENSKAADAYLLTEAFKNWKAAKAAKDTADANKKTVDQALADAEAALAKVDGEIGGYKSDLDAYKKAVEDAKKPLDDAFGKLVDAYKKLKSAKAAETKAERARDDFESSTPDDKKTTHAYKTKLSALKKAAKKAKATADDAAEAEAKLQKTFDDAKSDYKAAWTKYNTAYGTAKTAGYDLKGYADPEDNAYDPDNYDLSYAAGNNGGSNDNGNGGEGEGGSNENGKDKNKGKITPEEAKALAEFAVKYMKDAKSDPKTVASLKAALAKVTAAKKAKDAKALVSALKELKALVDPLMKKAPAKDTGKALESVFGSDVLYTKYKGLAVDLIKLGVTNIGAYDGLLNQLEFGLSRFGWDNVVKNFPEHGPHNNCDFLAWLRRHLTKAVKHYGHVEAAVKDIQAELNEDMKDAQARHDWDAVKVIDQKIALANGLREVAHHNLTRAKALLNSADDHARDLSCDTAAKEVRAAMDKEPNSPFKKSGQKNNGQKPNGQNGQKPNGGAAGHTLGKTGATVALVAVAASVLAGMGAALRKIRH